MMRVSGTDRTGNAGTLVAPGHAKQWQAQLKAQSSTYFGVAWKVK
jgi:hypothetical protein